MSAKIGHRSNYLFILDITGEPIEFFLPVTIAIIPDVLATNVITKLY